MHKTYKLFAFFLIIFFSLLNSTSFAESIGNIANNLTGPVTELTNFIQTICLVTGIALIFGALLKYRIHRRNPVEVPLSTPIMLLVVAIGLIIIYFLHVLKLQ